ncbi:hypothetical protein D3C76_1057070 [compost metagenome]
MFGDAGAVVARIQVALFEVQTQAADLGGLREGTDGGGRPGRQVETGTLGFGTHLIAILTLAVLGSDGRQTFFHGGIVHARRVTTGLNRRAPFGDSGGVTCIQRITQQRQLFAFLQGEGEPALHFRIQAGLDAQVDWAVQQ